MATAALFFTLMFYMTSFGNCFELNLKDRESIQISLPDDKVPIKLTNKGDKAILRYGFQRTHDCQEFNKAFLCIRKCLDLGYQIAHSDKECKCTCYKNKILAQYQAGQTKVTSWKLGAPTTSLPRWGLKGEPGMSDIEINANYTDYEGKADISASNDESSTPELSEDQTPAKSDLQADSKEGSKQQPLSEEQSTAQSSNEIPTTEETADETTAEPEPQ